MYNPASECLDIYADFVTKCKLPILNVVASSHESTEIGKSILNHFSTLSKDYDIKYNETVVQNYLLGHYMLNESSFGYKVKRSVNDLKKYKRVFLGHQHSPQVMGNAMHIGSCRCVSFTEYRDEKVIKILDLETDNLKTVLLDSPIPMNVLGVNRKDKDTLYTIIGYYDNRSKVKIIFNDLESYKYNINFLGEWSKKFVDFKIELNFKIKGTENKEEKVIDFNNDFLKWLDNNEVDDEIKQILKKEVKDVK